MAIAGPPPESEATELPGDTPSAEVFPQAVASNGIPAGWGDDQEESSLFEYWFLFRAHWRLIVLSAVGAAGLTAVVTLFVMTTYYRAEAVLRPSSGEGTAASMLGRLSGTLGGALSMFGVSAGSQDDKAHEYIAVLESYDFTMALLKRYELKPILFPAGKSWRERWFGPPSDWEIYQSMQKRFECEYDPAEGNLTLHFMNPDPAVAKRVLNLFIGSLRERLRRRETQTAKEAVSSMRQEAARTPDSLLQQQLYELIAQQVQREMLAQVQADFAFILIEAPVVPDAPYSPDVILDCAIALLAGLVVSSLALIGYGSLSRAYQTYARGIGGPVGRPEVGSSPAAGPIQGSGTARRTEV